MFEWRRRQHRRVGDVPERRPRRSKHSCLAVDSAHLANAFEFVGYKNDQAAYYFATPSGRWQCAILPREKAGCQATGGGALSVAGAPDTVPDADGESRYGVRTETFLIVIGTAGANARFAVRKAPVIRARPEPATLPFNRTPLSKIPGPVQNNQEEFTVIAAW